MWVSTEYWEMLSVTRKKKSQNRSARAQNGQNQSKSVKIEFAIPFNRDLNFRNRKSNSEISEIAKIGILQVITCENRQNRGLTADFEVSPDLTACEISSTLIVIKISKSQNLCHSCPFSNLGCSDSSELQVWTGTYLLIRLKRHLKFQCEHLIRLKFLDRHCQIFQIWSIFVIIVNSAFNYAIRNQQNLIANFIRNTAMKCTQFSVLEPKISPRSSLDLKNCDRIQSSNGSWFWLVHAILTGSSNVSQNGNFLRFFEIFLTISIFFAKNF